MNEAPIASRESVPQIPMELQADFLERVAILTAHRACHSGEHDPQNGKLHGACIVCGVDWPCEYAGKPPSVPSPTEALTASGVLASPEKPRYCKTCGYEVGDIACTRCGTSSPSPLVSVEEWTVTNVALRRNGKIVNLFSNNTSARHTCDQINASLASLTAEIERLKQLLENGWYSDFIAKCDECASLTSRLEEETKIVDRVWKALGITTYEGANGKAIDELVSDLRVSLAVAETA